MKLTVNEASLLLDALASHVFLHADEQYRRPNEQVVAPGSDHAENRAVIAAADALAEKIRGTLNADEACATCDSGQRLPPDADRELTFEDGSVQVYCRTCGRCLQA